MSRLLLRPVVPSYPRLLPLECLSVSPARGSSCAASVAGGGLPTRPALAEQLPRGKRLGNGYRSRKGVRLMIATPTVFCSTGRAGRVVVPTLVASDFMLLRDWAIQVLKL
jgi:hypothetical protein